MASPGQKQGAHGHVMTMFHHFSTCARREKWQGSDPCMSEQDCKSCDVLTADQLIQLSTPTYKARNDKKSSLVGPGCVLILLKVHSKVSEKVSDKVVLSTHDSKKATRTKDKKKFMSSTSFKDDLEALDTKWSEGY